MKQKKEHHIVISRVSSHMGPMYIEAPNIYGVT